MIDHPSRARPRFPGTLESTVAAAIRDKIKTINGGFSFSSAACGSDILFAEAMLEAGGEVTIVLPYEREQSFATAWNSDAFLPGGGASTR